MTGKAVEANHSEFEGQRGCAQPQDREGDEAEHFCSNFALRSHRHLLESPAGQDGEQCILGSFTLKEGRHSTLQIVKGSWA